MLEGKIVSVVRRHRPGEVCIEFTDGARLIVDHSANSLALSITEGNQRTS